ncbi:MULTISPECIES: phytoene/squalene synthase family protein [Pontibacter]|uniref:Phytoene/squalene synthetase n=1 Tax=Pontibacter lucknowensis TaxID=1077936 RepID=A0A1N6Z569_9BACT|nr:MULTISPECIES: phytoene/squalene synthase family protein [Pontibacter]EJF11046.1 squalene/phytoene synthase [Pontibacter sp. BAB1700]SIR21927.1 Phytoene/squalene synthetase [Pontibacter lucknowensis]
MDLYKDTCLNCSKLITEAYSTSFTLGIKTLHRKFHQPIYAIYGFVRCADEIVDTFHDFDKRKLLSEFRKQTFEAIEQGISLNPVLHAFQCVVNEYKIDREYIEAFLNSMAMDLEDHVYDPALYKEYIYGSAEVVGLMCLKVFCEGDQEMFERLKKPACSLGAAFQKVNFLRDMQSDFKDRGRVYFPAVDIRTFNNASKEEIEADIAQDFKDAYVGILGLPRSARMGVYLAYVYYLKLFHKIKGLPATHILNERVRVPDNTKLALLLGSYLRYQLNAI